MRNVWLFVLMLFAESFCFGAEVYPTKSVRVLVPYSAGGITDLSGRMIAQQLSDQLGRPFIIDNRPGAGGILSNEIVAKSIPDGYTLLVSDPSFTILPGLNKSLPYNPLRDFVPITEFIRYAEVLVINPTLKANTLKEFINLAQANPGKFNYGSGGTGALGQMMSELFKMTTKVRLVHVPYKGMGEAVPALIGGQVQMLIATIPTALPQIKSGRLRALAVTTDGNRSPALPDVPSMKEAGVSGMAAYGWAGLFGPAGMPNYVVKKLNVEVKKALEAGSIREKFIAQYTETVGNSQSEFSRYIRDDLKRWADVITAAGITSEQ